VSRILLISAEGIGNCVQLIPCIRTLKEVLGYDIDYYHVFGGFFIPKIIPYIDTWFVANQVRRIIPSNYMGVVSTFWTQKHIKAFTSTGLRLLADIYPLSMHESEVNIYMNIARDLGVPEKDLMWHGNCMYNNVDRHYDIVISDGYNHQGSANWKIKSYPYYEEAVKLLNKEYKVCSIGSKQEYINGTIDETGLPLLDSLGIIKNSKLLLSNDSGMYHCSNALEIPNVVIFTATSIEKNYDKRFHIYSTIVGRDDLTCRPCQAGRRWNKDCKTWDCREIEPQVVVDVVKKVLYESVR
jgi:ADP-heptose:LPS heptosyltransferase